MLLLLKTYERSEYIVAFAAHASQIASERKLPQTLRAKRAAIEYERSEYIGAVFLYGF